MFAYCGNNPVIREDDGGEFWHIVVGAAVGALVSGAVKVVSNAVAGKPLNDGVGIAMLAGAASGALASTGVGMVGMIAGNATISMAENAANQIVKNKGINNFDVSDMITDGVIGAVTGAIGGPGKGTKHLTKLGTQTVNRTLNAVTHKGVTAGVSESRKAFAYYVKNSSGFYKDFIYGLPADMMSTIGSSVVSSDFMKERYDWIWEGLW